VPLRRRLAISGDLEEDGTDGERRYDEALGTAVRRFQWRHGFGADGVVGKGTLAALNVPVGRRIEAILANLERWRWFGGELPNRYVRVNVPDYSLDLVESGAAVLSMPVVVGETDWQTPVLGSEIRRVIFNPGWAVPTSIAKKEILPKAAADAGDLKREGLAFHGEQLRQPPGPRNPLGRVKFEMRNPYGVYLHDTPSRRSFTRAKRALSHGCIRLRDPLDLADALLAAAGGWSAERRAKILSTWKTQSLTLDPPVPAYVLYATAWVDELGAVHFRDDVYERDPVLRRQMADAGRAPLAARSRQRRVAEPAVALP
jgi:murein L,D-transpeptidase YcbB/YkuD